MPKKVIPLTDIQVKHAKTAPKEVKLFDGGGLFLLIMGIPAHADRDSGVMATDVPI